MRTSLREQVTKRATIAGGPRGVPDVWREEARAFGDAGIERTARV
jgi:hypothetical protein